MGYEVEENLEEYIVELNHQLAYANKRIALKDEIIAELQKSLEISEGITKLLSDHHQLEAH